MEKTKTGEEVKAVVDNKIGVIQSDVESKKTRRHDVEQQLQVLESKKEELSNQPSVDPQVVARLYSEQIAKLNMEAVMAKAAEKASQELAYTQLPDLDYIKEKFVQAKMKMSPEEMTGFIPNKALK